MSATVSPYSFSEARDMIRRQTEAQRQAEQGLRDGSRAYAEAERAYRMALAQEITRQHAAGAAWTVAGDLARGEKHVADLKYTRDVADGVRDAASQAMFRLAADRRELEQLISWSMRVAPDGQFGEDQVLRAVAA